MPRQHRSWHMSTSKALSFVVINASPCQFVTAGCCWWSNCNFSLFFIACHKTLPATLGLYRESEGAIMYMTASDLLMRHQIGPSVMPESTCSSVLSSGCFLAGAYSPLHLTSYSMTTQASAYLRHMLIACMHCKKEELSALPQLKIQIAPSNRCLMPLNPVYSQLDNLVGWHALCHAMS